MRIYHILFLGILCIFSCKPAFETDPNAAYLILHNAKVIDPEKGSVQEVEMILIKDSLIEYVGNRLKDVEIPPGKEIDLKHKFLLPPLWDMHFHLSWDKDNDSLLFPLLLSKGIQGIRDMGGDLGLLRKMKTSLVEHPASGPTLLGAGPILDGNPPIMYDFSLALDSASQIESTLDSLRAKGADFFKSYSLLQENELQRIAAYSHKNGVSFQGHLSEYIDPETSIDLGQKSIEHLNRLDELWQSDRNRLEKIADQMLKRNTWLCPTLVIYQKKAYMSDPATFQADYESYIHPMLKQEWQQSRKRRLVGKTEKDWEQAEQVYLQQKALVLFLYQKGVKIVAGSDFAGMPYVYPGIGLLEELEQLRSAGIPDAEVLKIAIWHPIEFFEFEEKRGKITKGKFADFLILKDNPLEDIKVINSIEHVFRHGQEITPIRPF